VVADLRSRLLITPPPDPVSPFSPRQRLSSARSYLRVTQCCPAAAAELLSRTSCPMRRTLINVTYLVLRVVSHRHGESSDPGRGSYARTFPSGDGGRAQDDRTS